MEVLTDEQVTAFLKKATLTDDENTIISDIPIEYMLDYTGVPFGSVNSRDLFELFCDTVSQVVDKNGVPLVRGDCDIGNKDMVASFLKVNGLLLNVINSWNNEDLLMSKEYYRQTYGTKKDRQEEIYEKYKQGIIKDAKTTKVSTRCLSKIPDSILREFAIGNGVPESVVNRMPRPDLCAYLTRAGKGSDQYELVDAESTFDALIKKDGVVTYDLYRKFLPDRTKKGIFFTEDERSLMPYNPNTSFKISNLLLPKSN